MPGAGHLVHMPAHIYMRVGLYREASGASSSEQVGWAGRGGWLVGISAGFSMGFSS